MKNFLRVTVLAICAIFMVANVSAQVITAERASEIANQFFANGKQKSAAFRSTSATLTQSVDSHAITGESNEAPTFHILTGADGKGFVIVSGEETENPIIGYSLDGTINTDEMSTGMVDYLTDIDAQVKALRKSNAANPQKAAARSAMQKATATETGGTIVVELNTAQWAQGSPYNNYCFLEGATGTTKASTGCVPTAYSILCYYHKWPESAKEVTVYHANTGASMTLGHTYDYESMSNVSTEAGANAVATLMRDLGWAYQVSYGVGNTGTGNKGEGPGTLMDVFNYKSETPCNHGNYTSNRSTLGNDELWMQYIKESLDAGLPIPYSSTTSAAGTARHIYILDGYTNNNYFHFNWGWGGNGNGWFTLNNMVVDTSSDYSNGHKAYFKLMPNKTPRTVTATTNSSSMGTVSINGGTAGNSVSAEVTEGTKATLTAHPAEGYALANWTKNGVIVGTKNPIQVTVGESDNDYVANFDDASTVTVIQDYTINATSGTELTGTKVQEWAFNRNNDYPAELKLTSTVASINTNNAGDCIQLYLQSGTSETYTLSVQEDYEITKYTIRCKTSAASGNPYITEIAAEGQTYTPTTAYADYTFTKSSLARSSANTSAITITGSQYRALQVESITVTVAKEGANVPSTPTTYTINVNAETGGNAYVNGTNTSATVDAGTDVTLQAYPDGTNYTFAGWYNGNSWVSSNNPYTFALNSNVTYTAKFNAVATTYNITAEASPQNAGKVAINNGTQSTVANIDATSGSTVSLQAYPNSGYEFAGWYNGTTKVSSNNPYSITATAAISYIASFQEVQQGGSSSTNLAGKYFRLKVYNDGRYMNVKNHTEHAQKVTAGGVNIAAKDEDSNAQIFFFEQSGNGYMLKDGDGYYIKGLEWSVDASSTTIGSVLLFEETAIEDVYYIKWNNTYKGDERYFKVGADSNGAGDHPYCDVAANQKETAAAKWVLEEVVYYTVTATAGEGGSVSPLTSTIEKGKSVTLTATANEGYRFVNWTLNGNVVSTDATYTFAATEDVTLTANFAIKTYPVSVTASEGGSVAASTEITNHGGEVTLTATANQGYTFKNWTNANSEVVSTENPLTLNNVTEAVSLVANFEKNKPVNVVLTDNDNYYVFEFVSNDLPGEITKEVFTNWLKEKYAVIVSLGDDATFTDNGTDYTYANTVVLPFRISNEMDDAYATWYNIYYPVNEGGNPNYLAAKTEETTLVEKINDKDFPYGDNPTYNTMNGNIYISWAIYSVDKTLTFALKNKATGKFIQATGVATDNNQNVVFTDEANATAFTIYPKTVDHIEYYSLAAEFDSTTGYLCSTDNNYDWATHYNSNDHAGAWAKIEDPSYGSLYQAIDWGLNILWFKKGNGYCIITEEIQEIKGSLNNYDITMNTLKNYGLILEYANDNWPTIELEIEGSGTTAINGEEGVTIKRAPADYVFPVEAIPAEGYHFTKWTDATDNTLSTDAKYFTSISGKTGDVTTITANFEINTYTVSVTAGEGGSASASAATVEHGNAVTLTADENDGYDFAGWYNGEEFVSAEATYTFTVTSDINYTARFNEVPTGTVAIHIRVASTDGTTVTNSADGNVKAIIDGIGMEWATDADFAADANVALSATSDHNEMAYLFDGWYKNGVLVSTEKDIVVKATETATYEARFFRGCIVIGYSNDTQFGRVMGITLADGTSIGYDASSRAVVKAGTTVKINTMNIKDGYEVGSWINVNDEIVGTDNSLIVEVNEDVTYKAIFEPVSYELTVRANDDSYGTVSATSGTATGTTIKVGHKMEATITATTNTGYYFVNWTKGTEVVSTSATYTIQGISEYDDMVDVEYVANFLPVENATAGVYYRIAYDFPAAASAGAARAARAATDETHTYIVSPNTGTPNDAGTFSGSWTYTKNGAYQADLTMVSTSNGTSVNKINTMNNGIQHSLAAYYKVNGVVYGVTYTVSVPENGNYKIAGYSIGYTAYQNVTVNSTATNHNNTGSIQATGLDVYSFDFTVSSTSSSGAIDITNFEVYIQQVDGGAGTPETPEPETPANRYYMQSVACGVSGGNNLQNALKMTQETGAASIFYYADSKLLSYDKGTYVKEDGGTRGLQAVGESGTVTITTSGETTTIAAPSYLHAVDGTTRYVDHCGSNPDNHAANHNFVLEEVTTLPVTISSALHATFYAPVAVKIPEDVKAYVLKAEDIPGIETYAWMTSLKNGIIPANTGVIIKGAEGTYYFDIVENNDAARAEAVGNVLSGTVAKTKIIEDAYILANREGKIGLYPVAKNSYLDNSTNGTTVRFTNNSHKAYLPVTNDWFGEQLKKGTGFRFVYDDEETTGIDEFETELEDTIYDLQGRKLSEITEPGIYIVGGKKVWIK